jgi:hypothetical protein
MKDVSNTMNSFENYFDQDDQDLYNYEDNEDDIWDEDFSDNWNYWRTRWNKVELNPVVENFEIDLEEIDIQEELKEHQIYFLGLPEDVQRVIYNFVNPTHNYTYSN